VARTAGHLEQRVAGGPRQRHVGAAQVIRPRLLQPHIAYGTRAQTFVKRTRRPGHPHRGELDLQLQSTLIGLLPDVQIVAHRIPSAHRSREARAPWSLEQTRAANASGRAARRCKCVLSQSCPMLPHTLRSSSAISEYKRPPEGSHGHTSIQVRCLRRQPH
jgi:hypothetical protein